jgi:hypothetical protein
MKAEKVRRFVRRTVLIVGEGNAEVVFIHHLKSLYVVRGSGVALTIKNAHGKGALGVVNFTIRQGLNADYDLKAAVLDTDTDWNDKTQNTARKAKVQVVPCNPCIEAMLLSLYGDSAHGRSTEQYKKVFAARFDAPAHEAGLYAKHFPYEFLEKARNTSPVLEELLSLLKPA